MKAHFLFLFALSILAPGILSDMILTDDQKALFGIPTSNSNTPNDASLSGISEEKYRWPNGVVPYTLTGFSYAERRKILETISTLNDQLEGCINIRPYSSNTDVDYINIFKGEPRKCWSKVGRIGGHQPLSLGDRCIERGTITHELLHALGLYHEHQRSDRDNYVEIHRDNMVDLTDSKYKTNFAKCTGCKDYGVPYNIESVMHYSQWGFAKPNSQSITAHDSTKQSRMGTSTGLGMLDELLLRKMYKCTIVKENYRWPNGAVPYTLRGFSYAEKQRILEVISTLNDQLEGCITIRPYSSNTDVDYVDIFKGGGCWSNMGRIGGKQSLSLGNGCITTRTITRQLLHALGLHYELPLDRDDYIDIRRTQYKCIL